MRARAAATRLLRRRSAAIGEGWGSGPGGGGWGSGGARGTAGPAPRHRRRVHSAASGQPGVIAAATFGDLGGTLARRCAECDGRRDPEQYARLWEMVELCLRANGERLDARIRREFLAFDHLAKAEGGKGGEQAGEASAAAAASEPRAAPAEGEGEFLGAVKRNIVAPVLARHEEMERQWAAAKAAQERQWRQEQQVLSLYCHLLHTGGFQLCSQAHAAEHAAMQSSMGIGVMVDWSSLDSGMLSRFDAYGADSPFCDVDAPAGDAFVDPGRKAFLGLRLAAFFCARAKQRTCAGRACADRGEGPLRTGAPGAILRGQDR